MSDVDQVARAEMAQIKVQLHQFLRAANDQVDGLDRALKTLESVIERMHEGPPDADTMRRHVQSLRDARGKILATRQHLVWKLHMTPIR